MDRLTLYLSMQLRYFNTVKLLVKKRLLGKNNSINHKEWKFDPTIPFGFVIQFCNMRVYFEILPITKSTQTYI